MTDDGFSTPNSIVPFGKYKGEPVEVLLADRSYQDWLLAQDWFRDRYATIYQTVINYGGTPQDSPEHNELQATFLDDKTCLRLARRLTGAHYRGYQEAVDALKDMPGYSETINRGGISEREFENHGWDTTFVASFQRRTLSVPCTCGECDHLGCTDLDLCPRIEYIMTTPRPICLHRNHLEYLGSYRTSSRRVIHCDPACVWTDKEQAQVLSKYVGSYGGGTVTILVECKPDLGDDFPTVLRQVKRYPVDGETRFAYHGEPRICVVARRMGFERVTREQVSDMFKSSGISLILESEI